MSPIDLSRYPIDDPASRSGATLIATCRDAMRSDGIAQLPGFLTPYAVAEAITAAERLVSKGWKSANQHNIYFQEFSDDTCADDPRSVAIQSSKCAIAYDHLPPNLGLRLAYESQHLTEFVRLVLEKEALFRSADPLDALEIAIFEPGDQLGWHFDNSEFSITLMLREPESGGEFEFVRDLRSDSDSNTVGVMSVLRGKTTPTVLSTAPGTLALFHGRHSLHRVTPVTGTRSRINAVLTYGDQPGMTLSPLTQKLFYGRNISPI